LAVKKLMKKWQVPIEDLYLVHDDLDLALEKIKIVQGRGAAGHKGVESVIRCLETKGFNRIRLGIGRPQRESGQQNQSRKEIINFVLSPFSQKEAVEARKMVKKAVKMICRKLNQG